MKKDELIDWVVCGRAVGKATGWDQSDTSELMLYDFEPAAGVEIPKSSCVTFRFENGTVETYKDDGDIDWQADLIDAIKNALVERTD